MRSTTQPYASGAETLLFITALSSGDLKFPETHSGKVWRDSPFKHFIQLERLKSVTFNKSLRKTPVIARWRMSKTWLVMPVLSILFTDAQRCTQTRTQYMLLLEVQSFEDLHQKLNCYSRFHVSVEACCRKIIEQNFPTYIHAKCVKASNRKWKCSTWPNRRLIKSAGVLILLCLCVARLAPLYNLRPLLSHYYE